MILEVEAVGDGWVWTWCVLRRLIVLSDLDSVLDDLFEVVPDPVVSVLAVGA